MTVVERPARVTDRVSPPGEAVTRRSDALIDAVLAAVLFLAAAAGFHWLADAASASGVITGEEASITHRDALSLALHWQPSIWSTNFGSQVFYWITGHLTPEYGLLYGRPVKALALAVLSPMIYVVARRRLACRRPSATVAGVTVALLPGISTVAWIGTENGLEAVWGVAALFVATSRRRVWPLGLVLAGIAVSNYTAGLAWAGAVLLVCVLRVRSPRAALAALVGLAGGLAVVFAPLVWWRNGGIVVTGGGRAGTDVGDVPERLVELVRYAGVDGGSYYYFAPSPTLGGTAAAAALALAAVVATCARPRRVWPWTAVAVLAVGLYAVSSGMPGSRRLVAVAVIAALLLAVGVDTLTDAAAWRTRGRGTQAASLVVCGLALCGVLAATVPGTVTWHDRIESGTLALPVDWSFPVDAGGTQAETFARLDADLRVGRLTPAQVGDGWGGTRTLSVLYMLADRSGRAPALSPADILSYYRSTGDCADLDGASCP